MKVLGVTGWSGSGKTTLLIHLIPELISRGLRVSTVKHAHHVFDIDKPGKDSYLHRESGAGEVLISSAARWALLHENRETPEPGLDDLIGHMTPVDLILVEGFKAEGHAKLEVHRRGVDKPLLCRDDATFIALAADYQPGDLDLPVLDLNDIQAIADFVIRYCRSEERAA